MIHKVKIKSKEKTVILQAESGTPLMSVLLSAGFAFSFPCSGEGRCGKCKVIAPSCPVSDADKILLTQDETEKGVRLACRIVVNGEMTVELPSDEKYSAVKAETHKGAVVTGNVNVAVDIGTTSVAVYVTDETGKGVGGLCEKNSQARYGADVISRIAFCAENGTDILSAAIVSQIERMTACAVGEASVKKIVLTGNTTMLHLLLNESPVTMGTAPFTPKFTETVRTDGAKIGFKAYSQTPCIVMPGVSAFVGADVISSAVYCGMPDGKNDVSLLVDIGTNAEIILRDGNEYFASSASAGPAFECANIKFGMCAGEGAVKKVDFINGRFACSVIGNTRAKGICASGLIDAVAVFLKLGLVSSDSHARLSDDEEYEDFIYEKNGIFGIWLTDEVAVTQEDLHNIMLAKAALRAGIELLCEQSGKRVEDIQQYFLAGAFGASLDLNSTLTVGLLPKSAKGKIISCGNAAGLGAALVANDENALEQAQKLCGECRSVNLSELPNFEEKFFGNMRF